METKQEYWEGLAAGSFFLVATAAMMLVTLAVLDLAGSDIAVRLNGLASLVAVVFGAIGGLLLMVEAGNKAKAYLIIANPASMASKNAIMMTSVIGLAFIYATFFFDFIPWAGLIGLRTIVAVIGIIAALIAVMVPALELGEARGRAFWNSAALIPVFLITAAVTGMATVILAAAVMGLAGDASINVIDKVLLGFIVLQLLSVWGYVRGMEHSGAEEARRAAGNILHGDFKNCFWIGVIATGTVLPLALCLVNSVSLILIIKAILLLIGGACFRNIFLQAAVRKVVPGEEHEWYSREDIAELAAALEKRWQEKAEVVGNVRR
jgi:formate-dependent nitrite reductase membrane component NrfD